MRRSLAIFIFILFGCGTAAAADPATPQAAAKLLLEDRQLQDLRQGIERGKLKNEDQQKRAEQSKATVKSTPLDSRANAFTTYDAFPFDDLRQHLLEKIP